MLGTLTVSTPSPEPNSVPTLEKKSEYTVRFISLPSAGTKPTGESKVVLGITAPTGRPE